jgi:putative hemolysin
MLYSEAASVQCGRSRLTVHLAASAEDVREAQRLRYQVFAEEMGARLSSVEPGVDQDIYDRYCEHLLVREPSRGEVVGTYRILGSADASRIGGFYCDDEFDLVRLTHLRGRTIEVGRACVHPDYRTGATIALLWSGIARYACSHQCDYIIGAASVSMSDGGHLAASVYNHMSREALSPVEYRVFPRCPLPVDSFEVRQDVSIPALIKGYVRAGAYVCGEPAWDPDFNTADMFMLLPMSRINARYARHFLKHGPECVDTVL